MTAMWILFLMAMILILVILGLYVNMKSSFKLQKISPYECGFELMSPTYMYFSLQFYMIGLIFILFDLELILLIPMIKFSSKFFPSMIYILIFFSLLSAGYIYEFKMKFLMWK